MAEEEITTFVEWAGGYSIRMADGNWFRVVGRGNAGNVPFRYICSCPAAGQCLHIDSVRKFEDRLSSGEFTYSDAIAAVSIDTENS